MLCWDDLRFFLSVARTGSTLGAGKALKVSQTTAARRVAALEAATGLQLFERRQAGYALTEAGRALLGQAEAVEGAALAFAEAAAAQARDLSGTVRLTTVEVYAATLLPPLLRDLRIAHPGIRIELDTTEIARDLAAGEADVALRGGTPPEGGGLVGRRIAPDPWTVYCSRAYAVANGLPATTEELARHPIIGGGGAYVWPHYRRWLQHHGLEEAVVIEHGSTSGLLSAVRAGMGFAVLPSFMADRDPELVRAVALPPNDRMELWLLTHERIRHAPRVRAVMDFLGEGLACLARQTPSGGHA
ncbi:MAG TPA: LysR family transcriptional regulator [Allosphingosinicella sp.]|jgi:DNA-binding transcriptional LysR family regulator